MLTNPFLSSSNSNNTFSTNLYSNKTNDLFKTNNNSQANVFNPFKSNNNASNISFNNNNNNNDIFSRINTNINNNNNNFYNNNTNNPFKTNNTNNNTNIFNYNNNNYNNILTENRNEKIYNFNGVSVKLPICQTVDKTPITTFGNNLKYLKIYAEKNIINKVEYNNTTLEYICNDDNLKDFTIEEIRFNDYINGKIEFFNNWSNDNVYNPSNFQNNTNNNFLNNNTSSIFNQNNKFQSSNNGFNNTNPFLNNSNNNQPFNTNNNNNNIFNNQINFNNNMNNYKPNFLSNNNNNPFNNTNNNTINNQFNISTNKNIFSSNNNVFTNNNGNNLNINNSFLNTNNNNIFNTNNNNNNIFNTNNNNPFNNNNQNPFNSIINNNNNNMTNNINNNNTNFVNSVFNYNSNNYMDKPFEEKMKDPTWVKRNVKIMDSNEYLNWFPDYMNDINKINLKIKEIEYFNSREYENEDKLPHEDLIFNKIILPSDEEISNYYNNKKKSEENSRKKNKNKEIPEEIKYKNNNKWDPIPFQRNRDSSLSYNNYYKENNYINKKENKNKLKNKNSNEFTEVSNLLSNFYDNYVDFSCSNNDTREFILPTEKPEFNNHISDKNSYNSPSFNNNEESKNNIYNNNIVIDNGFVNNNKESYFINGFNQPNNNMIDKESSKNDYLINNNIINTNSNKTDKICSDQFNGNIMLTNNDNIDIENNIQKVDFQNECRLLYLGNSKNITELKTPIIVQLSSLIINQENTLNFDLLLDIIIKNILSIEDIENRIILPQKEDIYLNINGQLYSKLTNTEISIDKIEKNNDEKNNYYYIYYGFELRSYPLLENNDIDNKYMTNPSITDLLNPENNYNLKKIENFEIWNKYGKIIFLEPIDLSGKIILNDIIKINKGEIDLSDKRVDKLKARVFLYYDFGDKLEGTFLDNIKYFLKTRNSNYVSYENQVLEYTVNF